MTPSLAEATAAARRIQAGDYPAGAREERLLDYTRDADLLAAFVLAGDTPPKKPNAENKIRVLGQTMYLDSPTQTHGISVRAQQDEGWLRIVVEADASVLGYAVTVNGRDLPYLAGDTERLRAALERIAFGFDGDEFQDTADAFDEQRAIARAALAEGSP